MSTQIGVLNEIAKKLSTLNTSLCCKTFSVGDVDLGDINIDLTDTNAILNIIRTDLENAQLSCSNGAAKPFSTNLCNPGSIYSPIVTAINGITPIAPIDYSALLTDIRTNTSNINLNTDTVEGLIGLTNTAITGFKTANHTDLLAAKNSIDAGNATLSSIYGKLNQDCAGSPINVNVCNPGASNADFTATNAILTNILNKDTSIDNKLSTTNTGISSIDGRLITVVSNTTTTNTKLDTTNTNLGSIDTKISSTNSKLDTVNSTLTTISSKLSADCNSNPIKVEVCNNPSSTTYNSFNTVQIQNTATSTFSSGSIHSLSFVIIAGTATLNTGGSIVTNLPTGFTHKIEADTLIATTITITGESTGTRIIVTTNN